MPIFPSHALHLVALPGIIRSLANFLGRAERSPPAPLKKIHLEPLARLIPKNLQQRGNEKKKTWAVSLALLGDY